MDGDVTLERVVNLLEKEIALRRSLKVYVDALEMRVAELEAKQKPTDAVGRQVWERTAHLG